MTFCNHLICLIKGEGRLERANAKKNSATFAVLPKSRKLTGTTTNFEQVQKRLDSLLKKRGKFGQSQQEGGFIGATLCCYCTSMVILSRKGSKKHTSLNW